MGQWDDKFEKAERKWDSWSMQEYAQDDRVLSHIIEDKARQNPDHVVFQFRDDPLTLGDMNDRINQAANGFLVDDTEDSTNVQMVADLAAAGELDILKMQDNTNREERRALIQGDNFTADASLFGLQASSISPGLAGGATLLAGASKVAGAYNSAKTAQTG